MPSTDSNLNRTRVRGRNRTRAGSFALALAPLAVLLPIRLAAQAEAPDTIGPDVTVINLPDTSNWGATGGIRAYSVGTTSCNIGDAPIAWCDSPSGCLGGTLQNNDHPVIAQNIYRLKNNRFEQIGMSWLKHGWLSTNSPSAACGPGSCTIPAGGGDQLGIGCTDTYGSGLNGGNGNPGTCDFPSDCRLGQRSAINATTGDFPMPYANVLHPLNIDQRMQVAEIDVDPALNAGASYWVEGQYLASDDGTANNAFNNASYRRVTVGTSPFNLSLTGSTIREKSALQAWIVADPTVEIVDVDIPGSNPAERFEVARKVTNPALGLWHFEYAIRNMNSDRSAQAFQIDFLDGTAITAIGFKDIDHHSGEPYSTADWTSNVVIPTAVISWTTTPFATDANANALRFATLFNFWFEADSPAAGTHRLTFFKPGSPAFVDFTFPLFADGFESGNTSLWSAAFP